MVVATREIAVLTSPEAEQLMLTRWLTPAAAARYLGLSESSIRRLLTAGRLPCCRTGLGRLIDPEALAELAAARAAGAARDPG